MLDFNKFQALSLSLLSLYATFVIYRVYKCIAPAAAARAFRPTLKASVVYRMENKLRTSLTFGNNNVMQYAPLRVGGGGRLLRDSVMRHFLSFFSSLLLLPVPA